MGKIISSLYPTFRFPVLSCVEYCNDYNLTSCCQILSDLPCLGKRELILVLFVRLFGLCLFGFVGFLFLLGSGKGCGL